MNAEQKQRALTALGMWHSNNDGSLREYQAAELMAALLQELVCAPDAEPVAWMVKNGFVCSMIYRSKKDADNYAADQQKRHDLSGSLASFCVIPLYTAPPAPSVPDNVASEPVGYLYTNLQSGEYHVSDYDDDYRGPERVLYCIEPVYRRTKGQQP